jgi:hypothetical protein
VNEPAHESHDWTGRDEEIKKALADLNEVTARLVPLVVSTADLPSDHDGLRTRIADALRESIDTQIVAEWVCCDPVRPDHALCTAADQARRMVAGLLADDPDRHPERSPVLDAVLGVVGPEVQYLREELTDESSHAAQLQETVEKLRTDLDAATRFSIPAGLGFVEVRKDPALDSGQWSTHRCDFDGRRIRETWETHPDRDAALARAREIAGGA